MKKCIIFLAVFGASLSSVAQLKSPIVNGHAYQRASLPGTIPKGVANEDGSQSDRPIKPMITHFVYLEIKPSQNIKPATIWIRGKSYNLETEKITSVPVVLERQGIGEKTLSDTLVKKTENNVFRIYPRGTLFTKASSAISKKINKQNIVIEYYWKGKKYYYTISNIKNLQPLALQ
jgi:hypothetical protein